MKKNEELSVNIISLGINGEGIARVGGITIFVPFAIVGEKCKIKILKITKNIAYARLVEILNRSPYRVQPRCPYFSQCGGCQLQHLSYEKQLEHKSLLVKNNLKKIAHITCRVNKTIGQNDYEYRNKISLPIHPKYRRVGLYSPASHRVVVIDACPIQESRFNDVIKICNEFLSSTNISVYDEETHEGILRNFVARILHDTLLLTVVVNNDTLPQSEVLCDIISKYFDKFGLEYNINCENTNVIFGKNFVHIKGVTCVKEASGGITYNCSNASFMQVNNSIRDKIYNTVLKNINSSDVVIDAYSGAGLMTAMMSRVAEKVIGIEIVPQAVENANVLAKENNILNMENICGDVANILPEVAKNSGCSVIVLDPPRKGCSKNVLSTLAQVLPRRIIYVSCDSATLSRDLSIIAEETGSAYRIVSVQPFDMFPQTKHVECVVVLELKKKKNSKK